MARIRSEQGFGLVELLIAMTVLAVGVSAVAAAFTSGIFAINRADQTATAAVLADKQMEIYRGLTYDWITLSTAVPDSTYTNDVAYTSCQTTSTPACTHLTDATKCGSTGVVTLAFPTACQATQKVSGPDKHAYRIDTFVAQVAGTTGTTPTRTHKDIVVVVRDGITGRTLAREESIFDCATASTGSTCPTS